jgi:hypothetical protein
VRRLAFLLLLGCGQPVQPYDGIAIDANSVIRQNIEADTITASVIRLGKVTLQATRGTRGPNTRLMLQGDSSAGAELELVPGPLWSGTGVASQILLFAPRSAGGYTRFVFSIIRESQGEDVAVLDVTSEGGRPLMPIAIKMGEGRNSVLIRRDGVVELVQ